MRRDKRHTCERELVEEDRRGHGREPVGKCRGNRMGMKDQRHTCERELVKEDRGGHGRELVGTCCETRQ